MLESIIREQKDIQIDSIGRLLELASYLTNAKPELGERIEETCFVDTAKTTLEQARTIHDLIINISEIIKGGKKYVLYS